MNIVQVRSPFFISVAETGQLGSKIELFIWNNGTTEPTTPTYTFTKKIASATNIQNDWNISPFVKEFIDNRFEFNDIPVENDNQNWVNFKVKRYKESSLNIFDLLSINEYKCLNGYNNYLNGYNNIIETENNYFLQNNQIKYYYNRNLDFEFYPIYIEFLIDFTIDSILIARYINDSYSVDIEILPNTTPTGMYNYRVPITINNSHFDNGNTLEIIYNNDIINTFTCEPICEPKYTPVLCSFINRYGGAQFLTFFKAQTNTINTKGTSYKVLPASINYNPSKGQTKNFNINGTQNVKLNTGWVDENYSELIQDLMLSETVLLDGKPVIVKTQSSVLKTHLKDKNINYEVEFEYAYNLINDVV